MTERYNHPQRCHRQPSRVAFRQAKQKDQQIGVDGSVVSRHEANHSTGQDQIPGVEDTPEALLLPILEQREHHVQEAAVSQRSEAEREAVERLSPGKVKESVAT